MIADLSIVRVSKIKRITRVVAKDFQHVEHAFHFRLKIRAKDCQVIQSAT
ncbi:Uncharacterised protein [Vibrio cholerae]|nr:Uncharacterised protein [Vibrio cholerae]